MESYTLNVEFVQNKRDLDRNKANTSQTIVFYAIKNKIIGMQSIITDKT